MNFMNVSAAQVQKNRQGIKAMWKKIPDKWLNLGAYFVVGGSEAPRHRLLKECDGKGGPHNTCGAVGCFAGWNWTYHPYQAWCKRNKLTIGCTENLDVYLGLRQGGHSLWRGRLDYQITQREEVGQRLKELSKAKVYEVVQRTRPDR